MARKNDGAYASPKQIRTDVDCRAARPKFDNGRVESRQDFRRDRRLALSLRHAGRDQARQRCFQTLLMDYRFPGRQKTYAIGPYGNAKGGTCSLAGARRERDKAKDLLKDGKDPSIEKQLDKHRQSAT